MNFPEREQKEKEVEGLYEWIMAEIFAQLSESKQLIQSL